MKDGSCLPFSPRTHLPSAITDINTKCTARLASVPKFRRETSSLKTETLISISKKRLACTVLYCNWMYCTVLYCAVLCYAVLYCTVLYCTVLYCTVLYCSVLFCSVLFCSVLFRSVPFRSVPFCSDLFRSVPFCSVLFRSVLLCFILFYSRLFFLRVFQLVKKFSVFYEKMIILCIEQSANSPIHNQNYILL